MRSVLNRTQTVTILKSILNIIEDNTNYNSEYKLNISEYKLQ